MVGEGEYCDRAVSRVDFIKMENRIGIAKRDVKYLGLFKNFFYCFRLHEKVWKMFRIFGNAR